MSYNPNIPLAPDFLSVSQGDLLNNFSVADTSFGINHYKFSDLTANNGKHNNIQTPLVIGAVHPSTPANENSFYTMQDSAPLGLLQYSRGPSDAVPTPVTSLQSQAAALVLASSATTNVLDFTGLARAYGLLFVVNSGVVNPRNEIFFISWNGTSLNSVSITTSAGGVNFAVVMSGNVMQIKNNSLIVFNNVYWTLDLKRVQV